MSTMEPIPGLPPDLLDLDARLADAYWAERALLPVGVVNQAMMRLPNPVSAFVRATRWTAGVVLACGLAGTALLWHAIADPWRMSPVWSREEQLGYAAGVGAILLAMIVNIAAPRLAQWVRAMVRRVVGSPTASLTPGVLAWRVGAFVLLAGVWLALR